MVVTSAEDLRVQRRKICLEIASPSYCQFVTHSNIFNSSSKYNLGSTMLGKCTSDRCKKAKWNFI